MPTDSLAAVYAFAFVVSLGAVVSPGPVSAAIVTEAPRQGWRVGPLLASGHSLLELFITLLLGYGLGTVLGGAVIRRTVALAGGGLLIALGTSYLNGALRKSIALPQARVDSPPSPAAGLFALGMLTTASNPFWYAWWMTVAAAYLAQARSLGAAAVATFYVGHISADYGWDTLLALATSRGSSWLTERGYRGLITVTGAFLVYLGVVFIRTGLLG